MMNELTNLIWTRWRGKLRSAFIVVAKSPEVTTHLSRCPERVLGGHVLDVVGQRVVGQDVIGLVDAVHGVLEGELRRRILLVIFGK